MSAARTSEWTTAPVPSPTTRRPTLREHRAQCIPCRAGLGACEVGIAIEREAEAIIENAKRRAVRDARIARGEPLAPDDIDPPYHGCAVLPIGRLPAPRERKERAPC